MSVYEKLKLLDITLPPASAPVAAFVSFVRSGKLLFLSGHIAKRDGKPWVGQLGAQSTTADGKQAARGVASILFVGGTYAPSESRLDCTSSSANKTILPRRRETVPSHWVPGSLLTAALTNLTSFRWKFRPRRERSTSAYSPSPCGRH